MQFVKEHINEENQPEIEKSLQTFLNSVMKTENQPGNKKALLSKQPTFEEI